MSYLQLEVWLQEKAKGAVGDDYFELWLDNKSLTSLLVLPLSAAVENLLDFGKFVQCKDYDH